MSSQTLLLRVEAKADTASVTVELRPGGRICGPFDAPLGAASCWEITEDWKNVSLKMRTWLSCGADMQRIGARLFNATLGLNLDTQALYCEAIKIVEQRRQNGHADLVSIAVDCHGEPQRDHVFESFAPHELHQHQLLERLPWELMFDHQATRFSGRFLGAENYVSIRRVGRLRRPGGWRGDSPLRLLVVVASPVMAPTGFSLSPPYDPVVDTLALYRFVQQLQEQSGPVLNTTFLYGQDANQESVRLALAGGVDVLYFIGHSQEAERETWFFLEDGSPLRRSEKISATDLATMLRTSGVGCVFLSACDSLAAAAVLARFEHLHCVVAMQAGIPPFAATVFDEAVLASVVARSSVERSVLRGREEICTRIRQAMTVEQWQVTERPEWAIPVLFSSEILSDATTSPFESGTYQTGVADNHVEALERCGWRGDLPLEVTRCFRAAASRELRGFAVSHGLVTNDQYRYYLEQTQALILPLGFKRHGKRVELSYRHQFQRDEPLRPHEPVTGVTRPEAEAYCNWLGKRLPTADEYDVSGRRMVLIAPASGRVLEWTSDDRVDNGAPMGVVVGARKDVQHSHLAGFFGLRAPGSAYEDVGFRTAADL